MYLEYNYFGHVSELLKSIQKNKDITMAPPTYIEEQANSVQK